MICKKCGQWLSDDAVVCTQCGADPNAEPAEVEVEEKPQKTYKMGWYKFNIYFSLWTGGLINMIYGLRLLMAGEENGVLYALYPASKMVDMLFAVFCIALGAFFIYTRFQLAGYKQKGPKCLQAVYAVAAVGSIVYAMAMSAALGVNVFNASIYGSVIGNAVLMFVNKVYFLKRRKLFDK